MAFNLEKSEGGKTAAGQPSKFNLSKNEGAASPANSNGDTPKKSKTWLYIAAGAIAILLIWAFIPKNDKAPSDAEPAAEASNVSPGAGAAGSNPGNATAPAASSVEHPDGGDRTTAQSNDVDAPKPAEAKMNTTAGAVNASQNTTGGQQKPKNPANAHAQRASGLNNSVPASFAKASATLSNLDDKIVSEVLAYLKNNTTASVNINGYASSEGKIEVNQDLSQRRAEAFRSYMVKKGVAADRITATGKGIDNPIASNDTEEGRSKNRRVEVVLN